MDPRNSRRVFGSKGRPVNATTNAYRVTWSEGRSSVHHYDMITPCWETLPNFNIGSRKGTEIMMRVQDQNPAVFNPQGAYDGKKNLFSTRKYNFSSQVFRVSWDTGSRSKTPKLVDVTIVHVKEINFNLLRRLLSSEVAIHNVGNETDAAMTLNMLNVFVQATPRMNVSHIYTAKSFFTPKGQRSSRQIQPLQLWRGYFQSVRPTFDQIIVNVDVTIGIIMPAKSLENIIVEYLRFPNMRQLSQLTEPDLSKLKQFLKGVKVVMDLDKHKGRKAQAIRDIVADVGNRSFEIGKNSTEDGATMTVAQYFHQAYGIMLRPGTLGIRIGKDALFPITVCRTVEQLYKNRASPEVIREALDFTPPNPMKRLDAIRAGWQDLDYPSSQFLKGAGVHITSQLEQVAGRILPSPSIQFQSQELRLPRAGVWDVMRKRLFKPATIPAWTIVNFSDCDVSTLRTFIYDLLGAMQQLGMTVGEPAGVVNKEPRANIERTLSEAADASQAALIIVLLPEAAEAIYRKVKRFGDITRGCATQCIRWTRALQEKARAHKCNQYHNNMNLKINVKLGGINFFPMSEVFAQIFQMPTMIVGADVSHPGPSSSLPSIASVVGSYDRNGCRYAASTCVQPSRTEMIENMEIMFTRVLRTFYEKNGSILPKQIFVFRDGVSEGEFATVESTEIDGSMRAAIEKAYGRDMKAWPRLTFIVVGKRHHFKFFPASQHDEDRAGNGNLQAGFVVDRDIGHPVYQDFYLQSQPGLKGTSHPSHYTVLRNGSRLSPDQLQDLAYTLCHCYARSTRSVKVPAPIYYADLVCRRAKFHYDEHVHDLNMSVRSSDDMPIEWYQKHFHGVQERMKDDMYFV